MINHPPIESVVLPFSGHDQSAKCIEYWGCKNESGYGFLSRKKVSKNPILAHRYAYAIAHNVSLESFKNLAVMHLCDNPACINPQHLILGTLAENNADMKRKGRASKTHQPKGEQHGNARFTEEQDKYIRDNYHPRDKIFGGLALAKKFNTSYRRIWAIANNREWKHLP